MFITRLVTVSGLWVDAFTLSFVFFFFFCLFFLKRLNTKQTEPKTKSLASDLSYIVHCSASKPLPSSKSKFCRPALSLSIEYLHRLDISLHRLPLLSGIFFPLIWLISCGFWSDFLWVSFPCPSSLSLSVHLSNLPPTNF